MREVGLLLGLDEESLRTHPMRHVLTMAIGVSSTLTVRYYAVQLKPSMLLLLSSDGLHGVVDCEEIETKKEKESPEIALWKVSANV